MSKLRLSFACGPYDVPNARIDALVAYTNNPPCGAMRGFGAVQVAFAHESQMDRLASELGMDPVEIRLVNAMSTGTRLPTGQVVDGPAPVRELLEELGSEPGTADETKARDFLAAETKKWAEVIKASGAKVD